MFPTQKTTPAVPLEDRIVAAQTKLADLKMELGIAKAEVVKLEDELRQRNARIAQLKDGWHSTGEISRAENELNELLRLYSDSAKPSVVWANVDDRNGEHWIISRVTAKRIFVREAGRVREEQYQHNGTSPTSWKRYAINIPATFPNGLQVTK